MPGFCQPQGGGEGKEAITRGQIGEKVMKGVVPVLVPTDNDTVALEKRVGLMMRQEVFIEICTHEHGGTLGDLTPVMNRRIIWERDFAQTQQGEEPS